MKERSSSSLLVVVIIMHAVIFPFSLTHSHFYRARMRMKRLTFCLANLCFLFQLPSLTNSFSVALAVAVIPSTLSVCVDINMYNMRHN